MFFAFSTGSTAWLQRLFIRPPVVFDVRRGFRWRARAEFHRIETVLLVKLASKTVLLMCVQLQSIRGQALGKDDQTRSPAFAPLAGINIHSIDVRTFHREIRDNLFVESAHPNLALDANDFPKDL